MRVLTHCTYACGYYIRILLLLNRNCDKTCLMPNYFEIVHNCSSLFLQTVINIIKLFVTDVFLESLTSSAGCQPSCNNCLARPVPNYVSRNSIHIYFYLISFYIFHIFLINNIYHHYSITRLFTYISLPYSMHLYYDSYNDYSNKLNLFSYLFILPLCSNIHNVIIKSIRVIMISNV